MRAYDVFTAYSKELLRCVMNINKLVERLVDLSKQSSYRMSKGLTREEKRMFILNNAQKEGER